MNLALIIPSRGRPAQCERLVLEAIRLAEVGPCIVVAVDQDDPAWNEYSERLAGACIISPIPSAPHRGMVWSLNMIAKILAPLGFTHLAFWGDDHWPHTQGWDTKLVNALGGRPGVAYADDMHAHETLPTAAVLDVRLIQALGYMVPETLWHLYADDFWAHLGREVGNLQYVPQVEIEHVHPFAGKAQMDAGYEAVNGSEGQSHDAIAWAYYRDVSWPAERERMMTGLEILCG